MDLDEWEVLPDDGLLQIHDDGDGGGCGGGKKIFSRRFNTAPDSVFKMNYFICPPPSNSADQFVETTNRLVPLPLPAPFQFSGDHHGAIETEAEPDRVSQVFFKKMKESEFPSDMKLDSPKSNHKAVVPQMDQAVDVNNYSSPPSSTADDGGGGGDDRGSDGLNIWNWGMTGIGAIFSFGVAAVASTVCVLFIGSRQKHRQNQKLQFQMYSDDKRMKQMVHHANKMNEAISGVPITRAHITFGGHFDAFHNLH